MKGLKVVPLIVGIGVIASLIGGLVWSSRRSGNSSGVAAASQPVDILAAIPQSSSDGLAEKAIREGVAKAKVAGDGPKIWVSLGDALMQRVRETANPTDYTHAKACYEKALSLDNKNIGAMLGMAWVYGGKHEFDQSIEWARKTLEVAPSNAASYGLIGDANVEQGDYETALTNYQKMLDIRPDIGSYSRGAHVLWMLGDIRKAQWLMAQAIKSGSSYGENTAWCRAQLGEMLFESGALLPAEQVLAEGLKQSPTNRHCLMMLGKCQTARKNYDEAIATYKKALAVAPDHTAYAALADIYLLKGMKDEAEKQFAAIEELHTKHHTTGVHDHTQMALFYADHDIKMDEALRLAEAHKSSKNVMDADALAWCYYKVGKYQEAKEAMKTALRWNTPLARLHFHAGMIEAKLGNRLDAQKHLFKAINMNPHFSARDSEVATKTLASLSSVAKR